jgi:cytidine deaminase
MPGVYVGALGLMRVDGACITATEVDMLSWRALCCAAASAAVDALRTSAGLLRVGVICSSSNHSCLSCRRARKSFSGIRFSPTVFASRAAASSFENRSESFDPWSAVVAIS